MIREDVNKFLAGPKNNDVEYYILSALSDMQRLFQDTLNSKKSTFHILSFFNIENILVL